MGHPGHTPFALSRSKGLSTHDRPFLVRRAHDERTGGCHLGHRPGRRYC